MSGQAQDIRPPVQANFLAEIERTGVTTTELARALAVSERQVTRWRGGQMPRWEFVVRMARYFGRRPEWFYAVHEPNDEPEPIAA